MLFTQSVSSCAWPILRRWPLLAPVSPQARRAPRENAKSHVPLHGHLRFGHLLGLHSRWRLVRLLRTRALQGDRLCVLRRSFPEVKLSKEDSFYFYNDSQKLILLQFLNHGVLG